MVVNALAIIRADVHRASAETIVKLDGSSDRRAGSHAGMVNVCQIIRVNVMRDGSESFAIKTVRKANTECQLIHGSHFINN